MPPKIRELAARLLKAGYEAHGGKGSHRKFIHKDAPQAVVLSGKDGDDALPYQEKAVKAALRSVKA